MPCSAVPETGSVLACLLCAAVLQAEPPAPVRLEVHPSAVALNGPPTRHRLLAPAVATDGRLSDVTALAAYASQKPGVAVVSPEGECLARGDGETQVTVTHAGQSVSVPVAVRDAAARRPPSFLHDVTPLLTRLG